MATADQSLATLADLDARSADTGWIPLTLVAGATGVAEYRVKRGTVMFRFVGTTNDLGQVISPSLPAVARPLGTISRGVYTTGGTARRFFCSVTGSMQILPPSDTYQYDFMESWPAA